MVEINSLKFTQIIQNMFHSIEIPKTHNLLVVSDAKFQNLLVKKEPFFHLSPKRWHPAGGERERLVVKTQKSARHLST